MDIKGFPFILASQWQRIRKHHRPLLLSSIFVLWICGAGLLFLNAFWSSSTSASSLLANRTEQKVLTKDTPTPIPTATPTPIPTPIPIPTAAPISPFPSTLGAEVIALQNSRQYFYHGNPTLPEIALTFDDGPNPPYTGQMLNILRRYHVKASFFCMGENVQNYPNLVKREYQEGNIVGNHTWSHPYLPNLSVGSVAWQFSTTANLLKHITGAYPTFFRPPYGAYSSSSLTYANEHGLNVVLWNDDPQDWARPGVRGIVNVALSEAINGGIILLHDGGGNRSESVAALPLIIEVLQARGYSFVTLQQMREHLQTSDTQTPIPQGTPVSEPTTVVSSSSQASLPVWRPLD